jgi:hypothetical protein
MNVHIPSGEKKQSVSSLLWGYEYAGKDGNPEMVLAKEEKSYRESRVGTMGSVYDLERLSVLARNTKFEADSYFNVYRSLYPEK